MSASKKIQQETDEYKAAMAYRDTLQRLAEQSQSDYDKAVMTLSGGALGVSFGYMKDIAGPPPYAHSLLLNLSWTAWTLSVIACLFSLGISALALHKEIAKIDADWSQQSRGPTVWNTVTIVLNWSGGILFAVGAFLMISFVALNHHEQHATLGTTATATAPAISTGAGSGPNSTSGNWAASSSQTTSPLTSNPPVVQPNATPNPTSKAAQPSPTNTPPAP